MFRQSRIFSKATIFLPLISGHLNCSSRTVAVTLLQRCRVYLDCTTLPSEQGMVDPGTEQLGRCSANLLLDILTDVMRLAFKLRIKDLDRYLPRLGRYVIPVQLHLLLSIVCPIH